jgi:hypothetical protein
MNFNDHSRLEGLHAFLSASKYHWVNYSDEKLDSSYKNHMAAQEGTRLHQFASEAIQLGVKLPRIKKTLNLYVNDGIGFKMKTEQTLFYSENCFGTADAISFKNNMLRIHDLKTGSTPSSITQLEVYAALFCLEYDFTPESIDMELRIYQNDEVFSILSPRENVRHIMTKIKDFDIRIKKLKIGECV